MVIDAVTLEWLRRIGPNPSRTEVAELRAIRKGTQDPKDHRLLDAIIGPAERALAAESAADSMQRRLEFLDETLSDEGRAKLGHLATHEVRGMRNAFVADHGYTNYDAEKRAERVVRERRKLQIAQLEAERENLRDRLRRRSKVARLKTASTI